MGNRFPPWPKTLTASYCFSVLKAVGVFFIFFHIDTHVPGLRGVDLSKGSRVIVVGLFHM